MTQHAHVWLRLNPGSDVALMNALGQVMLENGWIAEEYIAQETENFAAFKDIAGKYTPEKAGEITGVSAALIEKAAKILGTSTNVAIYYTMGVTQHTSGVDNVTAVSNIALLSGNIGRPKTGVNPLRGQNNVQGACDMGALPDVLPGYQKVEKKEVRDKFSQAWALNFPKRKDAPFHRCWQELNRER